MSENKKSTAPPTTKRDANGRFIKGNAIGKETRVKPGDKLGTKYKEEYCEQIVEYFKSAERKAKEGFPPRLPTMEYFAAVTLGVTTETLHGWCKEYPQFKTAYDRALLIQKDLIYTYAENKQYDSNFSKFLLINNHGMNDQTKNETTFRMVLDADIDEESN